MLPTPAAAILVRGTESCAIMGDTRRKNATNENKEYMYRHVKSQPKGIIFCKLIKFYYKVSAFGTPRSASVKKMTLHILIGIEIAKSQMHLFKKNQSPPRLPRK